MMAAYLSPLREPEIHIADGQYLGYVSQQLALRQNPRTGTWRQTWVLATQQHERRRELLNFHCVN